MRSDAKVELDYWLVEAGNKNPGQRVAGTVNRTLRWFLDA
jgi:hypothetical protein